MFYIVITYISTIRWKTNEKSNENKEQGLILSLNNYSWALQEGTLTTSGVLSDGITKRLSQPVVLYYNIWGGTIFSMIIIRARSQFMGEIKAEWLSRCDVIVQFHIVALKIWGFFDGVVSSLARAWGFEDSNKTWMLFFF